MVIDIFTYNGEKELLDIRLNVLYQFVDKFIILESPTTFSGKEKPLLYKKHQKDFTQFADKITYCINNEDYSQEEIEIAESSPNTTGQDNIHRKRRKC